MNKQQEVERNRFLLWVIGLCLMKVAYSFVIDRYFLPGSILMWICGFSLLMFFRQYAETIVRYGAIFMRRGYERIHGDELVVSGGDFSFFMNCCNVLIVVDFIRVVYYTFTQGDIAGTRSINFYETIALIYIFLYHFKNYLWMIVGFATILFEGEK